MALTHLSGLAVSGTTQLSGAVIQTGSSSSLKTLTVTGTSRVSGIFSASASGKQSTLTKLNVTGTTQVSGQFSASASGKLSTFTKATVNGTAILSGKSTVAQIVITSAANAICGIRNTVTAGTAKLSVATTKVLSSSRIFLQPLSLINGSTRPKVCVLNTIASGVSFSYRQLVGNAGTAGGSGPVSWLIVNKT